jgi:CBS domain-containing protein
MDGDKLVGIFSERDYARKVILMGKSSRETPVRDLMTTAVFTVKLSDSLDYCLKMMTDRHIRHLPVLEKNRVVGVVTIGDVVKHIITLQKTAIQNLEEYITAR